MMAAGFLGLAAGSCKKGWLVTGYGIACVIISMLSIHMNYRFMGKELPSLPVYKEQCMDKPRAQHYCDKYIGTLALCGTAVLMLPFILTALLSCLAAKRTLRKKDSCIIWFTCSKVQPSQPKYNVKVQQYKKTERAIPIGLLRYKTTNSNGSVCEIRETRPTAEYLPRIPDFKDLAGLPDSPGYPASVMFEYENRNSRVSNNGELSKDVKLRKDNYGLAESKEQGLALIESGVPVENATGNEHAHVHVQRRNSSNHPPNVAATSEVDLSLLEQDYLNRRSYLDEDVDENQKYFSNEDEDEKYYSRAAEEWIRKVVDNLHDSRSRLYAVSDEEDLDEVPKRKISAERNDKDQRKVSTDFEDQQKIFSNSGSPPHKPSPDEEENDDESPRKISNSHSSDNTESYTTDESKKSSGLDENNMDQRMLSKNKIPSLIVPRRRKFGASSPCEIEQEPNYEGHNNELVSQSKASKSENQSETSTNDSQSGILAGSQSKSFGHDNSEKNAKESAARSIECFRTGDSTPHGIVTPVGQPFPTGSLHFEFEKAAPIEHARMTWVEFEGESENREKLLKGKMPHKEYQELTSYLM